MSLTAPNTLFEQIPGAGLAPLNQGKYKFVSEKGNADFVLKQLEAIPGMKLALVDQTGRNYPGNYFNTDGGVTAFWDIQGVYTEPNGTQVQIWESAGILFDRLTIPSPFVDKNPDGSIGGSVPKIQIFNYDPQNPVGQIYWNKQ